ncbi:hypothetical protein BS78_K289800 [Paspalum vaginatum]|uniref:Tyrosine N-monooxygenase n=1 Tax=Paspalum vaginatum TaxID=158149 RepID=A0A9W7XAQ4_9POAL|nr:hypothetical protein BS78_K289800 [Paspalum vaginatum]
MFAVVCTVLALALLYCWTKASCNNRRLPPGPSGLPVIGSMHHLVLKRPIFRWIHRLLKEMNTDILCLRFGAVHVIVVASPEAAIDVLRKNDAVFASRPITFAAGSFSFGYKCSSLSPYGDQWKKMRRVLTSEILSTSMERMLQCRRAEEADHLVRFHIINLRHVSRHFCGNMIRRLVFGKRHFEDPLLPSSSPPPDAAAGPEEVAHVCALFTLLSHLHSFSISDYIPAWIGLDLDGHRKVAKAVMETLNRLHDPIIEERIHEWSSLRRRGEKREARDFLDVLVSLQDSEGKPILSLDEIRAQSAEIMFATVDNPSNAVEWAFAEMMNKPEMMQHAIDELDTVVGKERLVQEHDIPRLNYLKACIREAFRLHPYHPFNPPHVAMEDTMVSGYYVPKGSHVLVSRVALGRNSDTWDAPLEFRPERHMTSNTTHVLLTEPDLRFITFSTGRRGCPGVSLGTSVTMMLFARLLQGFTWSKPPNVQTIDLKESTTNLALAEPLCFQVQPRLPVHLYGSI